MLIAGLDESGKGDYFGPLVAAAVALDGEAIAELEALGLKDSKRHTPGRIKELALKIQKYPHSTVLISPLRYNELYIKFKNLNLILGWAHSQALENLIKEKGPEVEIAILDRFSRKGEFARALEKKRLKIEIMEETEGEKYTPVAAASVLARWRFVSWMKRESQKLGIELPFGSSSPKVLETACLILKKGGTELLSKYAKLHFRITEKLKKSC
ncbi:MAG: ribonuclease HIII [Candidatus Aminicenantes bacterium]|nr:ribonuclease HIII [Candidatus Aminicenantes bacterium]